MAIDCGARPRRQTQAARRNPARMTAGTTAGGTPDATTGVTTAGATAVGATKCMAQELLARRWMARRGQRGACQGIEGRRADTPSSKMMVRTRLHANRHEDPGATTDDATTDNATTPRRVTVAVANSRRGDGRRDGRDPRRRFSAKSANRLKLRRSRVVGSSPPRAQNQTRQPRQRTAQKRQTQLTLRIASWRRREVDSAAAERVAGRVAGTAGFDE